MVFTKSLVTFPPLALAYDACHQIGVEQTVPVQTGSYFTGKFYWDLGLTGSFGSMYKPASYEVLRKDEIE